MHIKTLKRVIFASINLFYDVTPIGKIMSIYSTDVNIFAAVLFNPIIGMMEGISKTIVVISLFLMIANWLNVLIVLSLMFMVMYQISQPFLRLD